LYRISVKILLLHVLIVQQHYQKGK